MKKEYRHQNIFDRYNIWRKKVTKNEHYAIDIDFVEIDGKKPVAIIETTMFKYIPAIINHLETVLNRAKFQLDIQQYIADKLEIPLYLVIYDESLSYFLVYNYKKKTYDEMDQNKYIQFLNDLRIDSIVYSWM